MKTFLLLIMLLDAKTGEPIDTSFEGPPMELRECIELTMQKGPQPVRDGVATVFTCFNIAAKPVKS